MSAADPVPDLPAAPALPELATQLLGVYPGPALYALEGRLLASNTAAASLQEFGTGWWREMQEWLALAQTRGSRSPHLARIPQESGVILVEWVALPAAPGLLLLGRNVTLERSLNEVLTDSRDRFRDLVELSADLAFEVNADGQFSYIVGGQFLGYSAEELKGQRAQELQVRMHLHESNVFETSQPLDNRQCWLRRKDGSLARTLISIRPVLSPYGEIKGRRGVAKDITSSAARQEELAQRQRRDQLIAGFMKSVREAEQTRSALDIAAREINRALGGSGCRIYSADDLDELHMAVETGGALPEIVNSYNRKLGEHGPTVWVIEQGSTTMIGIATRQGARINGSIWLWRPAEQGSWPESDQTLLREVADHLGIVIAQVETQERLRVLSECDGLTRLYNRSTFTEKLGEALAGTDRASALFYIDLDNFKPVNDTHGHQRGDMVIRKVADILRLIARPGDLAGRMGGDEFVLWLEAVDRAEVEAIAKRIVATGAELRSLSAAPDKPLGLSVGAVLIPAHTSARLQVLMEKADAAMYAAKRSGKSTWSVVE